MVGGAGGGCESGESYEQAALRELVEETGISDAELGPCVWTRSDRFQGRDGVWREWRERYFFVGVNGDDVDTSRIEGIEAQLFQEHRWWRLDDISASGDTFEPADLAQRLAPLLKG